MSDIIAKAEARRAELKQELAKLDEFVSMYHTLDGAITPPLPRTIAATTYTPSPQRGTPHSKVIDTAKKIVVEKGVPLTRTQLVQALEARGMNIGGTDKSKNMGTIIWRSKAFDNVGDGYWPKGAPRPASQGFPQNEDD